MEDSQTPQTHNKQSKVVLIVILVVAVLAVAGVAALIITNPSSAPNATDSESSNSSSNSNAASDTTDSADSTATESTDGTAETATITFTDNGFTPTTLTVKKGTVVTVVNTSSHSVQFSSDDHPTHREDPEINMETLAPGKSGTFTATTVGTHGFHDHIDDSKVGTLIVTD